MLGLCEKYNLMEVADLNFRLMLVAVPLAFPEDVWF